MKLYSIINTDGETEGLLASSADSDTMFSTWERLCRENANADIDELEESLKSQGLQAERVYYDEIYP
jgi:hypothetical protein